MFHAVESIKSGSTTIVPANKGTLGLMEHADNALHNQRLILKKPNVSVQVEAFLMMLTSPVLTVLRTLPLTLKELNVIVIRDMSGTMIGPNAIRSSTVLRIRRGFRESADA